MSDELSFEENNHEYKRNGVIIPSVSQIIGDILINLDFISKELLEEKADLGKKIHKTTELYDRGNLNSNSLHPILRNYLNSWIKFRKDFDFEPIEIELMGFHPLYNYGYRIDRIGMSKKDKVLLDIKSGTKQKSHAIQTAGYKLGHDYGKNKKEQIKKRMTVYLSETSYEIEPNNNPNDMNVFLAALTIYNYKRSKK